MVSKPLVTSWSKAAIDEAGEQLVGIQRTVRLQCSEIISEAREWFLHVVQPDNGAVYLCNGRDEGESWHVWVQLGEYVEMDQRLPDNHPNPESRRKAVSMPQAAPGEDNEHFAEIGFLEH